MKKTITLMLIGLFALVFFTVSAMGADGDVYYFTTTDISFDTGQFGLFITVALFLFFFYIGYVKTEKRSGGAFMILSGFMFFAIEAGLIAYINAVLVLPLLSPFGIFILFLGIRKWLYPVKDDKTKSEGS